MKAVRQMWAAIAGWISWRWNLVETQKRTAAMFFNKSEQCKTLEIQLAAREKRIAELEASLSLDGQVLSAAEVERLALVSESCGRVAQTAAMVLRHGWDSESPYTRKPNRCLLERELGHMRAVVDLMASGGDVRRADMNAYRHRKALTLREWTKHQNEEASDAR
jgi:hypothetical protein